MDIPAATGSVVLLVQMEKIKKVSHGSNLFMKLG